LSKETHMQLFFKKLEQIKTQIDRIEDEMELRHNRDVADLLFHAGILNETLQKEITNLISIRHE